MADVTMRNDLVRSNDVSILGVLAQPRRKAWTQHALRSMGALLERLLIWITAKLTAAMEKSVPKRRYKRILNVVAFIVVVLVFLQSGVVRTLLWVPFAIFG